MRVRGSRQWVLWLGAAVLLGGCGQKNVAGLVLLDGEPLDGAVVVLSPKSPGAQLVVGTTGPDGRFLVTASAATTIKPGEYRVTVSKRKPMPQAKPQDPALPADFPGAGAAGAGPLSLPPELIPAKYSDMAQTTLSVDVPTQGELKLELTSK